MSELTKVQTLRELDLPEHAVVIADEHLPPGFLDDLPDPLEVAAGEDLKTLAKIEKLADAVLQKRSTKPMAIVAVGGGSVGDAVGFLASILWRGVELWHVPTTLLAMVDSAHGGKTAVNLGSAKNQLGTFYLADKVVLVEECLETLPVELRREGLAELVKGLWLGAPDALSRLDGAGAGELASAPFAQIRADLTSLLEEAITVKQAIVDRDPYEQKGIRTFLNFGHTVAHALELETGIAHGKAVAWGLMSASFLSEKQHDLSTEEANRLRHHVAPLVDPELAVRRFENRDRFEDLVDRDKKSRDGALRSVLLEAPGKPVVTDEPTAADWYAAFRQAVEWFHDRPIRLKKQQIRPIRLPISSSKSEMNRALVIRHLRPGSTQIDGRSSADDVVRLAEALDRLQTTDSHPVVHAGRGGTTFRFLLAVAASFPGRTTIEVAPKLFERPHGPLIEALEKAGAEIEPSQESETFGFEVKGWESWPDTLTIDASQSSQYASALALLAASGHPFELQFSETTDEGKPVIASRPYFDMTLSLLEEAGTEVTERADSIRFSATPQLETETALRVDPDASSIAVWDALSIIEKGPEPADRPRFERQPDSRMKSIARRLEDTSESDTITIDLSDSPDLAPVLTAAATAIPAKIQLVGAEHLRHKESDRIRDLADTLQNAGLTVETREDGLVIPPGPQCANSGSTIETHEDHRLAMAGLVASATTDELVIDRLAVIAKSYPKLWTHARMSGWQAKLI